MATTDMSCEPGDIVKMTPSRKGVLGDGEEGLFLTYVKNTDGRYCKVLHKRSGITITLFSTEIRSVRKRNEQLRLF